MWSKCSPDSMPTTRNEVSISRDEKRQALVTLRKPSAINTFLYVISVLALTGRIWGPRLAESIPESVMHMHRTRCREFFWSASASMLMFSSLYRLYIRIWTGEQCIGESNTRGVVRCLTPLCALSCCPHRYWIDNMRMLAGFPLMQERGSPGLGHRLRLHFRLADSF